MRVENFAFRSLHDKKFMKLDAQRRNTLSPSIDKKESHTGVTRQCTENKLTSTEQLTPASWSDSQNNASLDLNWRTRAENLCCRSLHDNNFMKLDAQQQMNFTLSGLGSFVLGFPETGELHGAGNSGWWWKARVEEWPCHEHATTSKSQQVLCRARSGSRAARRCLQNAKRKTRRRTQELPSSAKGFVCVLVCAEDATRGWLQSWKPAFVDAQIFIVDESCPWRHQRLYHNAHRGTMERPTRDSLGTYSLQLLGLVVVD